MPSLPAYVRSGLAALTLLALWGAAPAAAQSRDARAPAHSPWDRDSGEADLATRKAEVQRRALAAGAGRGVPAQPLPPVDARFPMSCVPGCAAPPVVFEQMPRPVQACLVRCRAGQEFQNSQAGRQAASGVGTPVVQASAPNAPGHRAWRSRRQDAAVR